MMFTLANLYFLLAEDAPKWWDYPGFEVWKFVNLFIFAGALVYVLVRKAKLGEAFKTRLGRGNPGHS